MNMWCHTLSSHMISQSSSSNQIIRTHCKPRPFPRSYNIHVNDSHSVFVADIQHHWTWQQELLWLADWSESSAYSQHALQLISMCLCREWVLLGSLQPPISSDWMKLMKKQTPVTSSCYQTPGDLWPHRSSAHFLFCRPSDEQHPSVRADAYVDDLAAAVNAILTDNCPIMDPSLPDNWPITNRSRTYHWSITDPSLTDHGPITDR